MSSLPAVIFACRPILFVNDPDGSAAYYRDVLGFKIGWRWSDKTRAFLEPEDKAEGDTLLVGRDSVQLIFMRNVRGFGPIWLHMDVQTAEEIDQLYKEWSERGANVTEPPALRPWGMYEMRVQDPDSHTFRVSAPGRPSRP